MELAEVVKRVAARYRAKCWWADLDDLQQEAWVAVLEAQQTWDPNRGVPLHAYAWQSASRRIGNYLWEQSTPVSVTRNHGKKLRGVTQVHKSRWNSRGAVIPDAVRYVIANIEADIPGETERVEQWWEDLSQEVAKVVRAGHNGDAAARVLLDREKHKDVAQELRWPVTKLWRATHRARTRIRDDIDLRHAMAVGA